MGDEYRSINEAAEGSFFLLRKLFRARISKGSEWLWPENWLIAHVAGFSGE